MPIFEIETPDGRRFQVDAPNQASALETVKGVGAPQNLANDWDAFPLVNEQQADPWAAFPLAQRAEPEGKLSKSAKEKLLKEIATISSGVGNSDAEDIVKVGPGGAAAVGTVQGAGANFYDEVYGLSEASGLPKALGGFRAPIGAVRLGIDKLFGKGTATEQYEAGRDKVRAITKNAERQQPIAYTAGQVGGALATVPLVPFKAAQGAGMAARASAAAKTGGVMGLLSGVGEGEDTEDRVRKGITGGLIGGVAGGVGAPVIEGVARSASYLARPFKGLLNPVKEGARRVADEFGGDPNVVGRATSATIGRANSEGVPMILADTGQEPVRRLARSASNQSPEAGQALNAAVSERAGVDSNSRMIDTVRAVMGGHPDATVASEHLLDAAKRANGPAYERAYRAGSNGLWSPELERLAGSDAVAKAMQSAASKGKDYAIAEGHGAFNPRVTFENGVMKFGQKGGVPTYPDLQFWDYTRRELSDAAKKAYASGANAEGKRIGGLAKLMNAELDTLVPHYAAAREGAARFFGAENMLEAGQRFVSSRMLNTEAARALGRAAPEERAAFQYGFASDLIKTLREHEDRNVLTNRVMKPGAPRDRIEMVLGPAGTRRVEAMLRLENIMNMTRNAVQGNSTTVRQLADMLRNSQAATSLAGGALLAGGQGAVTGDWSPATLAAWAAAGAVAKGSQGVASRKVSREIGEALASNDPARIQAIFDMAARNPRLNGWLRGAERYLARTAGEANRTFCLVHRLPRHRRVQTETSKGRGRWNEQISR